MRRVVRSIVFALTVIGAVVVLAFTPMTSVLVTLAATALYMGGTGHPLSIPQDTTEYITSYIAGADSNYVAPSELCDPPPGCTPVAVYTPAQFRFDTGLKDMTFDQSVAVGRTNLDACIRGNPCTVTYSPFMMTGSPEPVSATSYVVFGYSQSATVASIEKSYLIAHPVTETTVSFVLISNPNRPNGGVLERFVGVYIPIVGVTFNGATPTNSPDTDTNRLTTVDVARQYDPVADFPTNPLNLLADLNALVGFIYVHPEENYFDAGTPELQGQYQDTTYYLIPTPTLPLLMPLEQIPVIGPPLAVTLDPPMRVLVETGYDRTINPGQPTPAKWLYFPGPIKTAINFAVAIPTGWDNGIASITGNPANRPFHTTPQPTYGVGGPPVDTGAVDAYLPPTPLTAPASTALARQTSAPADTGVAETSGRSTTRTSLTQRNTPSVLAVTKPMRPSVRGPLQLGDRPLRRLLNGVSGIPKAPSTSANSSSGDTPADSPTSVKDAA